MAGDRGVLPWLFPEPVTSSLALLAGKDVQGLVSPERHQGPSSVSRGAARTAPPAADPTEGAAWSWGSCAPCRGVSGWREDLREGARDPASPCAVLELSLPGLPSEATASHPPKLLQSFLMRSVGVEGTLLKGVAAEERARDRQRMWDLGLREPLLRAKGCWSFGCTRLSVRNQKNMRETRCRPSLGTPV